MHLNRLSPYTVTVIMFILLNSLVFAQDNTDSPGFFTVYGEGPSVPTGESGDWDYPYTDPGAVVYHDGLFHMFRNGFKGWPASVQVGYLTSDDGLNWTEVSEDPVMFSDQVEYAEVAALASSALVQDDGTWVLYFYTWNTRNGASGEGAVGRATADDPLGPWTPDPEPVLLPGGEGEWDSRQVVAPAVIKTDFGYVMYYSGQDRRNIQQIGMAMSDDGIHWTKYDDPGTAEAPYAESDPILAASEDWEGPTIHQPRVERTDDGWIMVYRARGSGSRQMKLGLAMSEDGLHWTKYRQNPVFLRTDIPQGSGFWYTATAYVESRLYLYVESATQRNTTSIYSTYYDGPLPPAD